MAKILIMDDEEALRKIMIGMLKPTGHTLVVTENGTQAIEMAKKEDPDIALLDMRVPDFDGLEVLAHLKTSNPRIRCIMVSGFGDVESAVGAMKEGAFDYISKPFKFDDVMRAVNKALGAVPPAAPAAKAVSAPPVQASAVPSSPVKIETKKSGFPKLAVIGAISVAVIAAGLFFFWKQRAGSRPAGYAIPYGNASAITWNGQNLWVADWASQSVYKHNVDKTLSIGSIYTLIDIHPTGLAWDGEHLWSCSAMEKKITKHNMDSTLSPLVTFPNPLKECSALAWDGVYLWCADGAGGKIYKFKPGEEGLTIAGVYDGPATTPAGMFFHESKLWVANGESGKIFQLDPNAANSLPVLGMFGLEPYLSKTERISGIGFDGKQIWTCVQKANKVYRHSFESLKKLNF